MPGCSGHLRFLAALPPKGWCRNDQVCSRRAGVGMTMCAADGWQFYCRTNVYLKLIARAFGNSPRNSWYKR